MGLRNLRQVLDCASPLALFPRGIAVSLLAGLLLTVPLSGRAQSLPTLDQVLASKQDLWGLAAMQQPNGPSYEFFASLLPPLRYVNTDFRYYPIILSAPSAMHKVRFISNGSGVNLRAGTKTWKEQGIPLEFHVGPSNEVFGADPARLHGPAYEKGYLPIVELSYESAGATYEQEAFAPVHALSDYGVVLVRFRIRAGKGTIVAQVNGGIGLKADNNMLFDTNRQPVLVFDRRWAWDPEKSTLTTKPSSGDEVHLAIATLPLPAKTDSRPLQKLREDFGNCANGKTFEREQRNCQLDWQTLLDRGTRIETPEALVNNAWRSLIAGCFSIAQSNAMNYSAGNQYQRLYQAECGDAARALALFGYTNESGAMLARLFDYTRDGLEFHNAGFKLQAFSHWYWLTRDSNAVQTLQPKWEKELNLILNGREKESGLFPKERYCGDIATRVHSLNPNASCWRGLRDFAAVLDDMGESRRAAELTRVARGFRVAISNAVVQSEDRSTQPPFVPLMLFGEEKAYDHLTSTMVGSYWNLLAPYVIGSGVLPDRSRWMVDYLQEHGGICMGMIRFDQHSGLFANVDALDDLYGIRYTLKLLELDEVDRALVSFYGKLAQGLTRDTFIGAEGTGLRALDSFGRPMYLPPNSTADALFLWTLRYLLVQDWCFNDSGKPDTLRLCFATPKQWLAEGKTIQVRDAPTAFGPLSFTIESHLSKHEVIANLELPTRNQPKQSLLRIRLPDGWTAGVAHVGKMTLQPDKNGTFDVSALRGKVRVVISAQK